MNRLFIRIFVLSLLLPGFAFAASVTFDAEGTNVAIGEPFRLAINLSSDELVNAIELTVRVPDGFYPVDVSDGNSIVSLWIQKPHYSESDRTLTFSGVMPGGFSGKEGRILTVFLLAKERAAGTISILGEQSRVLLNSPGAEEAHLEKADITIEARPEVVPISNIIPDTYPPESFVPEIVQIPDTEGARLLVFSTQDKHSGLAGYELRERSIFFPWKRSSWKSIESPHLLGSGSIGGRYEIRAFDKAGNERIEVVYHISPLGRVVDILLALLYAVVILVVLDALRRTLSRK